MNVLILDGHPDQNRLLPHLLDHYQKSIGPDATVVRINARDLAFSGNLGRGYAARQPWEPDLQRLAEAIVACDHIAIGFPLWWGAEPALLKGLMDRMLLPGFAFRYHRENVWWDKLLAGRSADLIVTMDTPPWYLRLAFGDAVMRRWHRQVLGFCGVKPVRRFRFGPTRRGAAAKRVESWKDELADAAKSIKTLRRGAKNVTPVDEGLLREALNERIS